MSGRGSTVVWSALFATLMAVAGAAYLPGLRGPLLLDDYSVLLPLVGLPAEELLSVKNLFSSSGLLGRPLAMSTFALDALLHGERWASWKLTNLGIHLINAALLFALVRTLAHAVTGQWKHTGEIAFAVAALWLLHPLHVSTVLYTVQRMALLSTTFCFLGLLGYASLRCFAAPRVRTTAYLLAVSIGFTLLAALAKENGVLLPFFILALELTVFAAARVERPPGLMYGLSLCTLGPLFAGAAYIFSDLKARLLLAYVARDFTLGERLLTEPRVVFSYIKWIMLPDVSEFSFFHDEFRVTRDFARDTAAQIALAALVLLTAIAAFVRMRAPLVSFGLLMFILGLALESSVFALDLAYEHRTYLPMAGLLLIAGSAVSSLRSVVLRRALLAAWCITLLFMSAGRALVWGDEGALYDSLYRSNPASERALAMLAEWHVVHGATELALDLLDSRAGLTTAVLTARVWCIQGNEPGPTFTRMLAGLERSKRVSRVASDGILILARYALDDRCAIADATAEAMLRTLRARPIDIGNRYKALLYESLLLHKMGDVERALVRAQKASAATRSDALADYLRAEWLCGSGQLIAARSALATARAARPGVRLAAVDQGVVDLLARGCARHEAVELSEDSARAN